MASLLVTELLLLTKPSSRHASPQSVVAAITIPFLNEEGEASWWSHYHVQVQGRESGHLGLQGGLALTCAVSQVLLLLCSGGLTYILLHQQGRAPAS